MERDGILSHGISKFLRESMMVRSDKYNLKINRNTGIISDSSSTTDTDDLVEIPYSCKLLLQELQTMSVGARLVTVPKL